MIYDAQVQMVVVILAKKITIATAELFMANGLFIRIS